GPAQTRVARGLTYIVPVEGAFSYAVKGSLQAPKSTLNSDTIKVLPGQTIKINDSSAALQIPTDAAIGSHLWLQHNDQWIDFQVIPLSNAALSLDGNHLQLQLQSNLDQTASFEIQLDDQQKVLSLQPNAAKT